MKHKVKHTKPTVMWSKYREEAEKQESEQRRDSILGVACIFLTVVIAYVLYVMYHNGF